MVIFVYENPVFFGDSCYRSCGASCDNFKLQEKVLQIFKSED